MEEEYIAEMDYETVNQDFDDIDLFGTKMIEDDDDCDIEFEWVTNTTLWRSTKCVKSCSRDKPFASIILVTKSPPPELVAQLDRATAF